MDGVDGRLIRQLAARHPSDAARVVERFAPAEGAGFLGELSPPEAARILAAMTSPAAGALLAVADEAAAADLIGALTPSAAAVVMTVLGDDERARLLELVDEERRRILAARMVRPSGSAGALADPLVTALSVEATVADAIEAVRAGAGPAPGFVFVVERPATFAGQVATSELLRLDPASRLGDVVIRPAAAIHAGAGLRAIVAHPGWRTLHMLPVVDADGLLVGSLTLGELRLLAPLPVAAGGIVSAAVGLGELYWYGLGGALDGLGAAIARGRGRERDGGRDGS